MLPLNRSERISVTVYILDLEKRCNGTHIHEKLGSARNRRFSYSGKESESNDVMMQFEEFSNVHNSDRTSNATQSNIVYKIA